MNKFSTFIAILFMLHVNSTCAQRETTSGGGEALGSGGSVSWTVGQVAYEASTTASGSVYRGVQQPYEWLVTATPGHIAPTVALWPNPTAQGITLQWSNAPPDPARYTVHAMDGALVSEGRFEGSTAHLAMGHLAAGTYSVQVYMSERHTSTLIVIKQ